ncbi:MAG: RdgB/HAM1 family non-canonical purine NTP pyrophosphatase [Acidimicrobiia bacterium]
MKEPLTRIVVATANPDKAREIRAVLEAEGLAIELVPRPADVTEVEETGTTLVDNARLKARALVEATGLPAVADDTGLEVDSLGGAPGAFSARYAGEDATYAENVVKLLDELTAVRRAARTARFRTVVVLASPDGGEVAAEGVVEGVIADAPAGDTGFGYDPVFRPAGGGGRSFAEMTPGEKDAISHRGRALRSLARKMRDAMPTSIRQGEQ